MHHGERDVWNDYNDRQKFEHELINRTTTWLLTSQALLFAAYGITYTSECAQNGCADDLGTFRHVVAGSGLITAATMFLGVLFLFNSKRISWTDYKQHFKNHGDDLPEPLKDKPLQWGVNTVNTCFSLATDLALPVVFIGAWTILILSVG